MKRLEQGIADSAIVARSGAIDALSPKSIPAGVPIAAPWLGLRASVTAPYGRTGAKVLSWNLLRLTGASPEDVAGLIERERPDLLLMQECTRSMSRITSLVGGHYVRAPLPGRIHGLATWSPHPLPTPPTVLTLPAGAMFHRVCQVITFSDIAFANVHLSHGQVLNRRQLRWIAKALPYRAAIIGDYNLVGPALLPGFRDVGPREPTHVAGDIMPLRIDRCLVRGVSCLGAKALLRETSDHRPIVLRLAATLDAAADHPIADTTPVRAALAVA
ncbi:MAG: endonuclease/exonuclease/phosphatase family protein [Rhodospirillales bacterium]|nr:endonuclease/exonuclease/phosphatase family protein [Rhodospirillales bacterium]